MTENTNTTTTAAAAIPGEALCKAALWNTITMCQGHLAGRSHATAADIKLYEGLWRLIEINFLGAVAHPTTGDYIPQTQAQPAIPGVLTALEQLMAPGEQGGKGE